MFRAGCGTFYLLSLPSVFGVILLLKALTLNCCLQAHFFFVFMYSAVGLVLYKGKLSRIFPHLFIKEQKS